VRQRILQETHGTGRVVGFKLIEDVRAVRHSCGDEIENNFRQTSHGMVVFLERLLKVPRSQQLRGRPDVGAGAHEEPASCNTQVIGGDVLAQEEAFL
jgi:hypothetical protein